MQSLWRKKVHSWISWQRLECQWSELSTVEIARNLKNKKGAVLFETHCRLDSNRGCFTYYTYDCMLAIIKKSDTNCDNARSIKSHENSKNDQTIIITNTFSSINLRHLPSTSTRTWHLMHTFNIYAYYTHTCMIFSFIFTAICACTMVNRLQLELY